MKHKYFKQYFVSKISKYFLQHVYTFGTAVGII